MKNEKILCIIFSCILFASCNSTRVLSGDPAGTREHRELENEIRAGETELAITGTEIKNTSNRITESVNELEQSIENSKGNEQEITDIIQSIRGRKLPDALVNELENRKTDNIVE